MESSDAARVKLPSRAAASKKRRVASAAEFRRRISMLLTPSSPTSPSAAVTQRCTSWGLTPPYLPLSELDTTCESWVEAPQEARLSPTVTNAIGQQIPAFQWHTPHRARALTPGRTRRD